MSGSSDFMGRRAGATAEFSSRLHRAILDLASAGWSEEEIAGFVGRSGRHVRRVKAAGGLNRLRERASHTAHSADARIFSRLLPRA